MANPDVTGDRKVGHTPDPRKDLHLKEDQHLILEGLEDHV